MCNKALDSLSFFYMMDNWAKFVGLIYTLFPLILTKVLVTLLHHNWGSEGIDHPRSWLVSSEPFKRSLWLLRLDFWSLHFGSLRIRGSSSRPTEKSRFKTGRTFLNNDDLGLLTIGLSAPWDPSVWTRPQIILLIPFSLKSEVKPASNPKRCWTKKK